MTLSPTIIIYLSILVLSIVAYAAALKSGKAYIRILFFYLLIDLFATVLSIGIVAFAQLRNNLFLFHFYTPIEYLMLCLVYHAVIFNRAIKRAILISIPVFACLCVFFALYVQGLSENNSYIAIIESILVISWSLLYLREVLLINPVTVLYRYPLFWITVGVLVYFTENLVLDGVLAYLIKNTLALAKLVYAVSFIFSDIFLLSLLTAALCEIKERKRE